MGVRSSQPRSPNLNKTDGHLLEYFRQNFGGGGGGTNPPPPSSLIEQLVVLSVIIQYHLPFIDHMFLLIRFLMYHLSGNPGTHP